MINLEILKLVLYDYDDTLCIHEVHGDTPDNEHLYNIDVLLHGKDAWNTGKPNIHMKKFIDLCTKRKIRQGLISSTVSYKHMVGKCEWVRDNYGVDLENFCVGTFKAKLDMMLAIADAYNYERDEIL